MIELNHECLASLILSGFKFVLCIPDPDNEWTQLHPLKNPVPEIVAATMSGYVIPIVEPEIIAMADGVEDYRFYLAEDIF